MWHAFIQSFQGWTPIISHEERWQQAVELFANTSGNVDLSFGAFLPYTGNWMFGSWSTKLFDMWSPSI